MDSNLNRKTAQISVILGILFGTVLSAKADEAVGRARGIVAECERAKNRFLVSEIPTPEDAEMFIDCFRVDFIFGTITRVVTPTPQKGIEHCHHESDGVALDCKSLSRG